MIRKQDNAKKPNWKEMLAEQEDFLRPLIQEVVQQVLEAEMDEACRQTLEYQKLLTPISLLLRSRNASERL